MARAVAAVGGGVAAAEAGGVGGEGVGGGAGGEGGHGIQIIGGQPRHGVLN